MNWEIANAKRRMVDLAREAHDERLLRQLGQESWLKRLARWLWSLSFKPIKELSSRLL